MIYRHKQQKRDYAKEYQQFQVYILESNKTKTKFVMIIKKALLMAWIGLLDNSIEFLGRTDTLEEARELANEYPNKDIKELYFPLSMTEEEMIKLWDENLLN